MKNSLKLIYYKENQEKYKSNFDINLFLNNNYIPVTRRRRKENVKTFDGYKYLL